VVASKPFIRINSQYESPDLIHLKRESECSDCSTLILMALVNLFLEVGNDQKMNCMGHCPLHRVCVQGSWIPSQ